MKFALQIVDCVITSLSLIYDLQCYKIGKSLLGYGNIHIYKDKGNDNNKTTCKPDVRVVYNDIYTSILEGVEYCN